MKLNAKTVTGREFGIRFGLANHPQRRPWGIEVRELGREEPFFQLFDDLLFLRRLLDLGKAVEVCVARQLGWHGALGAQKEKCQFFEARFTCFCSRAEQC